MARGLSPFGPYEIKFGVRHIAPSGSFAFVQMLIAVPVRSDRFYATADRIPALPGAYLLLVELTEITFARWANRTSASLAPGRYIYAGSAYGSGGLKARVSRHVRRAKRRRWHIDQLTKDGNVLGAWIFPSGIECDLIDMNSALPAPIAGFGSTDCTRCRSWRQPLRRRPSE